MKAKQKHAAQSGSQKTDEPKAQLEAAPDDSGEDSDMEMNFALLSKKSSGVTRGEEEESSSLSEGEEEGESLSEGEEEDLPVSGGEEHEDANAMGDCSEDEEDDDDGESDEEEDDDDGESDEEGSTKANDDAAHSASGEGGASDPRADIKKELSTMSFEEIQKFQNKVGTKAYNEIAYGSSKGKQPAGNHKRLNKNRPMEISSKRPSPFLRQVVPVKKPMSRDPRFDDLSGEYKPEIFEKTYKFINDIKEREKNVVEKRLKKTKSSTQTEKLQGLLKRMENQERARLSRERQREKELAFKRERRAMAGQGLKPFFLKNSDKKKLELAEKYSELKKSGKLENFLSKKRKRNATKDRRKLPFQLPAQ